MVVGERLGGSEVGFTASVGRLSWARPTAYPGAAPGAWEMRPCHAIATVLRVSRVQVRGVPEDVHLARLRDVASLPTVPELAARIRARAPYGGPSSAVVIRAERDAR